MPPDTVDVWFRVTASHRPENLADFLGALAQPEFTLEACREAACLISTQADRYSAHWNCRFAGASHNALASIRLLKRLTEAGFHIMRFDGAGEV